MNLGRADILPAVSGGSPGAVLGRVSGKMTEPGRWDAALPWDSGLVCNSVRTLPDTKEDRPSVGRWLGAFQPQKSLSPRKGKGSAKERGQVRMALT